MTNQLNKNKSKGNRPSVGHQVTELRGRIERLEVKTAHQDNRISGVEGRLAEREAFGSFIRNSLRESLRDSMGGQQKFIDDGEQTQIYDVSSALGGLILRVLEVFFVMLLSKKFAPA